jgi:hypothetical protein
VLIISRRVLEHPDMKRPFEDVFDQYGKRTAGHDMTFCQRANALGFKVCAALTHPTDHWKMLSLKTVARSLYNQQVND